MTKQQERDFIFDKCNGYCAYCGTELQRNNFEVDHFDPIYRNDDHLGGNDTIENKMPECRPCNRAKKTYSIETWRKVIANKMTELNRDSAVYRMAKRFGLIKETKKPVEFYFEILKNL